MANDILSYKKFTIQTIVNPGTFYAVEYGRENQNDLKQYIWPNDVKKFKHLEGLSIGQIVAVKHKNEFHRGLITDVYNRYMKPIYYVLLVDNGSNIETSADSIFMIRNSELRNKKSNAFEIILHDIQPVTIELFVSSVYFNCNEISDNLKGILHKRESSQWSPAAFKFIKDLFKMNKCIYVKCLSVNGPKIIGDIYYKQFGNDELMSLAQTLCDRDFAVFCRNRSKIARLDDCQGNKFLGGIERRIPNVPEDVEWEELSVINPIHIGNENESSLSNTSICSGSDKSLSAGSDKFLKNSGGKLTSSFSPSWIVKKMNKFSQASSESFKSSCQHIEQTEKASPKVTLFRVIQRNVQLYDKNRLNV